MVQNKYVFDPYPLSVTMQRLAENLKARRMMKNVQAVSVIYHGRKVGTLILKHLPLFNG